MNKIVELVCWLMLSCKRVEVFRSLWFSCLLLLCSCSLIKNQDLKQQKQESHSEMISQEKSVEKSNAKKHIETRDSTTSNFSLLIKPIGSFSYSEKHGFVGNAEYVMLSGQLSNQQQTLTSENTNAESRTKHKIVQTQTSKASMSQKIIATKRTLPIWLYPLLVLSFSFVSLSFR